MVKFLPCFATPEPSEIAEAAKHIESLDEQILPLKSASLEREWLVTGEMISADSTSLSNCLQVIKLLNRKVFVEIGVVSPCAIFSHPRMRK